MSTRRKHVVTRPVVIARSQGINVSDRTRFYAAVADAIERQSVRMFAKHMEELEQASRNVDESELELI